MSIYPNIDEDEVEMTNAENHLNYWETHDVQKLRWLVPR